MKRYNIFLIDTLSEVELTVEVIDALSYWTAHVLVMMLYTQECGDMIITQIETISTHHCQTTLSQLHASEY